MEGVDGGGLCRGLMEGGMEGVYVGGLWRGFRVYAGGL